MRAARHNAELNGVEVDVRESDVFEHVDGVFDLIVFDPPFRWFAPRDMAERATTDEDYRALTTFFEQFDRHLAPDGRVLLFPGTSGERSYAVAVALRRACAYSVSGAMSASLGQTIVPAS